MGTRLSVVLPDPAVVTQALLLVLRVAAAQLLTLNNCNLALACIEVPMLLSVTVGKADCAWNLYQTSGDPETPQKALIEPVEVALTPLSLSVPATELHVPFEGVRVTALLH